MDINQPHMPFAGFSDLRQHDIILILTVFHVHMGRGKMDN